MKKITRRYWTILVAGLLSICLLMVIPTLLLIRFQSDLVLFIWVVLFILGPVVINAIIAREKGVSMIVAGFLGLIFSVLATIALLVMPYGSGRKAQIEEGLGWFPKVRYRIGGSTAYSGDLIITSNAIYYFPLRDTLETQQSFISVMLAAMVGGIASASVGKTLGAEVGKALTPTYGQPYGANMPKEALTEQLDTFFEQNKERFAMTAIKALKTDITNVSYTSTGHLTFDVPKAFDNHDLKIGYVRARKLRDTLKTEGYLS